MSDRRHGREPHLRRDRGRRDRQPRRGRSPSRTSSSSPPSPATPTRPISTRRSPSRRTCKGVVAHGMLTGRPDLQPAGQPAAGRRHGLCQPGSAVRGTRPCRRHDHGHGHRAPRRSGQQARIVLFDCSCTNQDGADRAHRRGHGDRPRREAPAPPWPSWPRLSCRTRPAIEALIRPTRHPADPLRRGAPVRRELAARVPSRRRGRADRSRSWSGRRPRSAAWPKQPASTSRRSSWSTCRTAMPRPPRRSSWCAPARPSS